MTSNKITLSQQLLIILCISCKGCRKAALSLLLQRRRKHCGCPEESKPIFAFWGDCIEALSIFKNTHNENSSKPSPLPPVLV